MGIKGLTTFVRNKSQFCMEPYELHDTDVVIDGDAVLCQLYLKHTYQKNACFGGDYDKFGNTIYKFFLMLFECKITPYVILDGAYESRKMETILERFKGRLERVETLNPKTQARTMSTPLFIRETFEDIAVKLNIRLVRCDFEGDRETASIAKALNCPVMSNDSDFFIFDVPYIPFLNLKMGVVRSTRTDQNSSKEISYKYIPCEIYKIDKFVSCVGGMKKENLPLLSALVGNDFMNGVSLSKLNLCKGDEKNINMIKRIEILISWLTSETKESAMEKILNTLDDSQRQPMTKEIDNAINGYTFVNSKYFKYLKDDPTAFAGDEFQDQQDFEYNTYEELTQSFPVPFIENFRKSLYPTRFLDILTQHKYYNFKPQVELSSLAHTHTPSIEIMSAVHKVLTGSQQNLVCLVRIGQDVGEQVLPLCNLDLPTFADVQKMDIHSRKQVILKILEIDVSFVTNTLAFFPDSWHLFILTLKYMISRSVITWPLVYSLIICKILIIYVDSKIGFHRSIQGFDREYGQRIRNILQHMRRVYPNSQLNVKESLDAITFEDALLAMSQAIPYFEIDPQLFRNSRLFDRGLMHATSQFQSVFLHVKCLNQLFNMPFTDFFISDCFNGTFVYNLTNDLRRQQDIDHYIKYYLRKAPLILFSFELIVRTLKGHSITPATEKRRRVETFE